MTWDEGLRAEQRSVVESPRTNTVLLAGPGTGKTFVLVRRIEYLLEIEILPPESVTAITFTRAAAAEMRERLTERLGPRSKRIRVSTLHSYALRSLIRRGAPDLPAPVRVAGDWEERWIVVEELARLLGRRVSEISNKKDGALDRLADDWDTLAADGSGWEEGFPDPKFLGAWRRHREVYGYTLRSELVYQLLLKLREDPSFIPDKKLAVLIVDEYQDLNRCDLSAIRALAERTGAEVFAAGDDDQSIYSFRQAHPAGIREFGQEYGGSLKRTLTECLRCGPAVVDLANFVIAQESDREPKELVSVTDYEATVNLVRFPNQDSEAAGVARIVKNEIQSGIRPEEILVLVKADNLSRISNAVAGQLENLGEEAYLPRAQSLTNDDDIQRLVEFLILAGELSTSNRLDDLALRALLELEPNSIGSTRLWRALELALERGLRFSAALEFIRDNPGDFTANMQDLPNEMERITQVAKDLIPQPDETFPDWLARACDEVRLNDESLEGVNRAAAPVLAQLDDVLASRSERVESAVSPDGDVVVSLTSEEVTLDFVQELSVALSQLGDTLPPRMEGKVTITTMHGAKGLSADVVVVLQAEDEVIPDELDGAEYDEARRLLYVSLSRARRKLIIGACQRRTGPQRFVGNREIERRSLSRFLKDYKLEGSTVQAYLRGQA